MTTFKKAIYLFFISSLLIVHGGYANENKTGFVNNNMFVLRWNPRLLAFINDFVYRIPLSQKSGILWEKTFMDIGIRNGLSPTSENINVIATIQPIAFCKFSAETGYNLLYNKLGYGYVPFNSANADYSPEVLEAKRDADQAETQGGFKFKLTSTLQAMFGSIVMKNATSLVYNRFQGMDRGMDYYYEYVTASLHNARDTDFSNALSLLYRFNKSKFYLGGNYYVNHVLSNEINTHRVSLLGLKEFDKSETMKHNFILMVGTYLKEKYYKHKFYFQFVYSNNIKI